MTSYKPTLFILIVAGLLVLNDCTPLSNPMASPMNPALTGLPEPGNFDRNYLRTLYSNYATRYRFPENVPLKRSGHQVEVRSINQFKNCYFSPVQCVLLERRRR